MFTTVKNQMVRNKLIKVLAAIVAGTASAQTFAFVEEKYADQIAAAEPTFLLIDKNTKNPANAAEIAVKATEAGIAASAAAAATPAAPKAVAQEFALETGIPVPELQKRGGPRSDIYPFAKMEVGQSFLVKSTEAKPNPVKSLTSTVSSATKRFATKTGNKITRRGKEVDEYKNTRVFVVRPAVPTDPTNKDARVFRTA
jgi:hypothetical protein